MGCFVWEMIDRGRGPGSGVRSPKSVVRGPGSGVLGRWSFVLGPGCVFAMVCCDGLAQSPEERPSPLAQL